MRISGQWELQRLDELMTVRRTVVQPSAIPEETPYIGLEHVQSGTGQHTSIPAGGASLRSSKFWFEQGDILFGKLRPNLRKITVAKCSGVCSTDIVPLCPQLPQAAYLFAFQMRAPEATASICRFVVGQSLPRITVRDLRALYLAIPSPENFERLCRIATLLAEAMEISRELDRQLEVLHQSAVAQLYPESASLAPLRRINST